jgi:hypothetical protein
MKLVPLTQGKFAMVDDDDYERVMQHKWCVFKSNKRFYASTKILHGDKTWKNLMLHRFILNKHQDKNVCFKDKDGFNCCKGNLIELNAGERTHLSEKMVVKTSKYVGVHWSKQRNKWLAIIRFKKQKYDLGGFENEADAAMSYNTKALELYGENAKLNVIG